MDTQSRWLKQTESLTLPNQLQILNRKLKKIINKEKVRNKG